jgi:hypothetical protein
MGVSAEPIPSFLIDVPAQTGNFHVPGSDPELPVRVMRIIPASELQDQPDSHRYVFKQIQTT